MPMLDALIGALENRRTLLVLDNTEHLPAITPVVAALIARCAGVSVLATGRAPLRARGERVVPVPPLGLPEPGVYGLDQIRSAPAVALFCDRAEAAAHGFELTAADAPVVATLCRRLDGLPLALELAAARLRVLSPAALLARLDRRLSLLTGDERDRPAQHQTLRATVAWSGDLLTDSQRRLFRHLAVWEGGCRLDALPAACDAEGDDTDRIDAISALVDSSLVTRAIDADGEPRFSMLETVRAYALEQLGDGEDAERARSLHARHFLALAERLAPELTSAARDAASVRLDDEHANLRAAFAWAATPGAGRGELALRLAGALWVWFRRVSPAEGRRWAEAALALAGEDAPVALRARARFVSGQLALTQGDGAAADALARAVALWRGADDSQGLALALSYLALALPPGDGLAPAEESLARAREAGDRRGEAWALAVQGELHARAGDASAATPLLTRSVALYRELGDRWLRSIPLAALGRLALDAGDADGAREALTEALAGFQASGDTLYEARTRFELGQAALLAGDVAGAAAAFAAVFELDEHAGRQAGSAAALAALAALAHRQRRPDTARRLLALAAARGPGLVDRLLAPETWPRPLRRTLEAARAALTPPAALDDVDTDAASVVAAALQGLADAPAASVGPVEPAGTPAASGPARPADGLSARELEVLRLLAEGATDAAIAAALVISPHTVHRHVSTILAKTGAENRGQAAAYARRYGLDR